MKENTICILTNENFYNEIFNTRQPVLVEFSTDWCGTSHILTPVINDMAVKFRDDIKFCKIDIDDNAETAEQYGVQRIPTILLFENGKVVDSIIGAVSREVIVQKLAVLTRKRKDQS